jgi:hypothetical protein
MTAKTWNIPTDLFSEYVKTKDGSELLALAYCIKAKFGASCLFDFSPKKIKEVCGCCIEKARLLYLRAKSDTTLFRFDKEKNVLFAVKLTKDKKIGHFGKRGQFKAEYLDCIKVALNYNYKLKDAIKEFRELSAGKIIDTITNDKSNNAGNNRLCGGKDYLSLKTIGKLMGTSKSTAYRTTKSMKDKGLIGRTFTKSFHITSEHDEIPFKNDFIISRTKVTNNGIKFKVNIAIQMGKWFMQNAQFRKSFSRIIFNHAKRVKSVIRNYSVDLTKTIEGELSQEQVSAYFSVMEH